MEEFQKIIANTIKQETEHLMQEITYLREQLLDLKKELSSTKSYTETNEHSGQNLKQTMKDPISPDKSSVPTITTGTNLVQTKTTCKENTKQKTKQDKELRPSRSTMEREVVGTNTDQDESSLTAAQPQLWIYVGRCDTSTTEDQLAAYLQRRCSGQKFDIHKLNSKGKNASFRVGADTTLESQLYNPAFWPRGILVKRYTFFRRGSFSDHN